VTQPVAQPVLQSIPRGDILPELLAYRDGQFRQIRTRHQEGAPSPQIVSALAALVDEIIERLVAITLMETSSERAHGAPARNDDLPWAVVALGGYGRRELNPYSDVDIMLLVKPEGRAEVAERSTRLFQLLWDLKYQLGHSLRSIDDCVALAREDLTARTALMESRYLLGNLALFETCHRRLAAGFRPKAFVQAKREERCRDAERYGSTTFLLEPNVKRSPGGLRDLHAIKWIAMALTRRIDWHALATAQFLTTAECDLLQRHQAILWQIRNDMHFHAGRASDVLNFDEQQRLAEVLGYQAEHHLLPVEQFMQCYYRVTAEVHEICDRLFERAIPATWRHRITSRLLARTIDRFIVTDQTIALRTGVYTEVATSPALVMELFKLSHQYDLRLTDEARQAAVAAVEQFPSSMWQTPEIAVLFLTILGTPGRLAETLRSMHRTRLLGRLLPAIDHATGLMQFNRYHSYTVDEHCIRAVGEAERLAAQDDRLGSAYRDVKRKALLHLALLLHDVGKGYEGDHSKRGVELAEEAAGWLGLSADDRQLLAFLVREHLLMSNIAFRRDLNDESTVLRFARQLAQPEALTLLYLLTAADIRAVGPEMWTNWKGELLRELFDRAMEVLAGSRPVSGERERIRRVRETAMAAAQQNYDRDWLDRQFDAMPTRYWLTTAPDVIVRHLAGLRRLDSEQVVVTAATKANRGTSVYTVFAKETVIPGIFSKIAGVLAAKGTQILGAQVYTRLDGTIVDRFEVLDPDYKGPPPPRRIAAISAAIQDVLTGRLTIQELFAKSRRIEPPVVRLAPLPTQVEIDNDTSDEFTIVDVFADDRQGLLYVITNTLFEAGLSVSSAKVSTRLDQIADVFYVTRRDGAKLGDPDQIADLKRRLLAAVTVHLTQPV
jgi:[protein-PII] uridylyltransferase